MCLVVPRRLAPACRTPTARIPPATPPPRPALAAWLRPGRHLLCTLGPAVASLSPYHTRLIVRNPQFPPAVPPHPARLLLHPHRPASTLSRPMALQTHCHACFHLLPCLVTSTHRFNVSHVAFWSTNRARAAPPRTLKVDACGYNIPGPSLSKLQNPSM